MTGWYLNWRDLSIASSTPYFNIKHKHKLKNCLLHHLECLKTTIRELCYALGQHEGMQYK